MKPIYPFTQIKKNIQSVLLVIILLVSFLSGSVPRAQAQQGGTPRLFSDAANARPTLKQAAQPFAVRSRYVNVNFGLLLNEGGQARKLSSKPEIELNLFPDVTYTGVIDRIEKNNSNSNSWIGTIKGKELSYFYLVISNGIFIAHIASQAGIYEVSSAGDDLYRVIQIDQSQFSEGNDARRAPDNFQVNNPVPTKPGASADSGSQIDVMILYTSAARAAEGSVAAMDAHVDLAITESNAGYTSSGVTPRLNLVYKGEVNYAESGDMSIDLDKITNPSDGIMDEVQTLRNTYGADLVQLVVETGGGCGLGWFMGNVAPTFESLAFSVVLRNGCMTGNYSSGHEFGHNQGAQHDLYVEPGLTPYPYSHGYVNLPARWRTIMSYNNQCADTAPGTYCTRLQYWSNPTNAYNGAAMGVVSSSENYLVLNNTASTVANFRQAIGGIPSIFTDVPSTYWAWNPIERLYNAGITGGCSTVPLMYCPEGTVTRAQMAIFILRGIHGKAYIPPAATGIVFTDVPASYWAAGWIEQFAAEGITSGCGGSLYCPDSTITRAQMAIFLLRGKYGKAYVPPAATGAKFTDVPASYWAAAWIEQLATEGVTSGCGGGNYCPDSNVTRAQMAVFLVKTFNLP